MAAAGAAGEVSPTAFGRGAEAPRAVHVTNDRK
jgi:hypothetical protein